MNETQFPSLPSHSQYEHLDLVPSWEFAAFYIAGAIATFAFFVMRARRRRGKVGPHELLLYAGYAVCWPLALLIEAIFALM